MSDRWEQLAMGGRLGPSDASLGEQTQRRSVVASGAVIACGAFALAMFDLVAGNPRDMPASLSVVMVALLAIASLRAPWGPRVAGHAIVLSIVSAVVAQCCAHTGLWGGAAIIFGALPPIAGLLTGVGGTIGWTATCLAAVVVLAGLGESGLIVGFPEHGGAIERAVILSITLGTAAGATLVFLSAQQWNRQQLQTMLVRLERENEERRAAEQAAREARQAAEDARDAERRFLATMSHELRTPLHGIIGTADLIDNSRLPSEQAELVDALRASSQLLMRLINDLLDQSRLEAGQFDLESVPVDLRAVVTSTAAPMKALCHAKNVELMVCVDPSVPDWVVGDPTRLGQVLLNLLGNAVKFTREGEVQVLATVVDGRLRVEVKDTGIGMDADGLARLFERFQQADAATSRHFGGSGLGMSIVKGLVGLMDGTIDVHSEPDQGTNIVVWLPLVPAEPPTGFQGNRAVPRRPLRVLVVDDSPLNRFIARKMLQARGDEPVLADSGTAALALVDSSVDVVLMDCQMPGMSGLETTRQLRARQAQQGGRRLPIIAVSASSLSDDHQAALDAGMDAYLTKPYTAEDLDGVLMRWFEPSLRAAG